MKKCLVFLMFFIPYTSFAYTELVSDLPNIFIWLMDIAVFIAWIIVTSIFLIVKFIKKGSLGLKAKKFIKFLVIITIILLIIFIYRIYREEIRYKNLEKEYVECLKENIEKKFMCDFLNPEIIDTGLNY